MVKTCNKNQTRELRWGLMPRRQSAHLPRCDRCRLGRPWQTFFALSVHSNRGILCKTHLVLRTTLKSQCGSITSITSMILSAVLRSGGLKVGPLLQKTLASQRQSSCSQLLQEFAPNWDIKDLGENLDIIHSTNLYKYICIWCIHAHAHAHTCI